MFFFKKIVAPFLYPVPLCLELLFIGLILLWFTRKQVVGKTLVTCGSVLLALLGYGSVSGSLIGTLEDQYPPLRSPMTQQSSSSVETQPIKWIVVLAGGMHNDPTRPLHARINDQSRLRLLEGIRLHRLLPGSQLIFTGGSGVRLEAIATVLGKIAEDFGVKKADMVLEVESRDTKDHPRFVAGIVKNDPFILVTSAFHMPRSMQLFAKQGLTPIPAPTGYLHTSTPMSPGDYFPGLGGLQLAQWAVHEYLGLTWAELQGQV
jgi:uncharacterized SAM-binding protein YcdF (DUF218 family)